MALLLLITFSLLGCTVTTNYYDSNQCEGMPDGNYPLRDVFQFLSCKNNHGEVSNCPQHYIYDATIRKCISLKGYNKDKFCEHRSTSNWRNPWDCHGYIACVNHQEFLMKCANSRVPLVYNPTKDVCVHATEYECKEEAEYITFDHTTDHQTDPCHSKPDGQYSIPDVFKYMVCKGGKSSYTECGTNMIYEPGNGKCVSIATQSVWRFCENRTDGYVVNPWNCHRFFSCVKKTTKNIPCPLNELNYDPYKNACVMKSDYPCKQIPADVGKKDSNAAVNDNPCEHLPDNDYAIRDVFKYMTCKNGQTTYTSCEKNQIYEPKQKKCVDIKTQSKQEFCQHRSDGDWSNPWNCHEFFKCYHTVTHEFKCQLSNLVYDPYKDQCVYPNEYQCKQVDASAVSNDNPCEHLPDNDYAIRDVFKYMTCKNGQTTYTSCEKNQIYEPKQKKCVDIKTQSKQEFCQHRSDGDWSNPWNCHEFFKCYHTVTYEFKCQLSSLVYDPYKDQCVYPNEYQCKQVKTSEISASPCDGKQDGNYPLPDVFKYIICKGGKASEGTCPTKEIFDPKTSTCIHTDYSSLSKFCDNRADGDWRNPWNCNGYLLCKNHITSVKPCFLNGFIFNPYADVCELTFPCKTIYGTVESNENKEMKTIKDHKETALTKFKKRPNENLNRFNYSTNDFCTDRKDGNYVIPDVFAYMKCKNHKATIMKCNKDQLFDEITLECDAGSEYTKDTFCLGRSDGHYRNPWNCHGFVSCIQENYYEQTCPSGLVFDPYNNICDYPDQFPCTKLSTTPCTLIPGCVNIKDRCKWAPDGVYPIRDVFKYVSCKNRNETVVDCKPDYIFVPVPDPDPKKGGRGACQPAKSIKLTNFCDSRTKCHANWKNPWDCSKFISCVETHVFEHICPAKNLVYNPDINHCVYKKDYDCKQLKISQSFRNPPKCLSPLLVTCVQVPNSVALDNTKEIYGGNANDVKSIDILIRDSTVEVKDICTTLPDGEYAPRNVREILVCKDHKGSIRECPDGEIFIPGNVNCTSLKKVNKDNFCVNRTNGNWLNPWDNHMYCTCSNGHLFVRKCPATLVYEPVDDTCERPKNQEKESATKHTPHELASPIQTIFVDEPCSHLADGIYAIRDVMTMLVCKNHKHSYVACDKGMIYVPGNKKCTPVKDITMDNFCKNRADGNWQNPWNCHHYITCHVEYTFDRPCSIKTTLNYNPYLDLCAYPFQYKCKQIVTSPPSVKNTDPTNPCAELKDGSYAVRDVFKYLVCKEHKAKFVMCDEKQFYSPVKKQCVTEKKNMETFCLNRSMGNWRNPWNCHGYITCVGKRAFERPCSKLTTLNYDPNNDMCEYPKKFPCKQLDSGVDIYVMVDEQMIELITL